MKVGEFKYKNNPETTPVEFPFTSPIIELSHKIVTEANLNPYEEDDLNDALEAFINKGNQNLSDSEANGALNNTQNVEDIIKYWEKLFKEETVSFGDKNGSSDSELFSTAYHKLVHSGVALEPMLQFEHGCAHLVAQMIQERDEQIENLTKKQTEQMLKKQKSVSSDEINNLDRTHFDEQSLMEVKWISTIETLKETQRREYREWVMKLLEEHQTNITLLPSFNSPTSPAFMKTFPPMNPMIPMIHPSSNPDLPSLEESFTIHLGSQMKQIYNIRILAANILGLCSIPYDTDNNEQQAQRIQTALALYTNDLCGTVLLTDSIADNSGFTRSFVIEASKSTDFHVDNVEKQLENIRDTAKEYRNLSSVNGKKKSLNAGDVVITKHSNLCLAHFVFHTIIDDSVLSGDMNSRHTIILAIRNIMKVCCSYDITTLTVPLLLCHEMKENMTVIWCTKRAELVFKCVKGFMIEMTSWGGSELKNLQFVVPKGISEEVFGSLAAMLPSIFRVSTPLVFRGK